MRRGVRVLGLVLLASVLATAQHRIPTLPEHAPDPVELPSGLSFVDLRVGTGVEAERGRVVRILYTGWVTKTAFMFDYRDTPENPLALRLGGGGVIRGLSEGIIGMKVGGKRRLLIPARLAHGAKGTRRIPANSHLTYDVELVAVSRPGA
jgi:FKBP-type peptidyl-prolyl cis-trans isomerase FkpA